MTKFYCKLRPLIYYKLRQFYYKLRQLLQIATNLLQINTAITNCGNYYKLRQNTYQGYYSMLRILKILYGFCFAMFRWCILPDVVVVHGVIHFKILQFPKWWKFFYSTNLNKRNIWQQQEGQEAVCIYKNMILPS